MEEDNIEDSTELTPLRKEKREKLIREKIVARSFRNLRQKLKESYNKKQLIEVDETALDYNVEDHFQVLFQLYGSIWPTVIPWCLYNTLIALVVHALNRHKFIDLHFHLDLSFSMAGHNFMSLLVSFLVVSRCASAYGEWMTNRQQFIYLLSNFRELVQFLVTFTRNDNTDIASSYRFEIARRAIVLLRVIIKVLEFDKKHEHIWLLKELTPHEIKAVLHSVGGEIERHPLILTIFLRSAIASHQQLLNEPLACNEELKLLDCTYKIVTLYHKILMNKNTRFPFPLLQMGRTFVIVFVFTIPFAVESVFQGLFPILFVTFFMTFGLLGVEFINIELMDPFSGENIVDFDCLNLSKVVNDDIYIAIADVDGWEQSNKLKDSIEDGSQFKYSTYQSKRESWGHGFSDVFQLELMRSTVPRDSVKRGSISKESDRRDSRGRTSIFSNILDSVALKDEDSNDQSSIELFDSNEVIKVDLKHGRVGSSKRDWSTVFKKRGHVL